MLSKMTELYFLLLNALKRAAAFTRTSNSKGGHTINWDSVSEGSILSPAAIHGLDQATGSDAVATIHTTLLPDGNYHVDKIVRHK